MEFKQLVEEMKGKGIETALLKSDGGLVYSNFAMHITEVFGDESQKSPVFGMDDPAPSHFPISGFQRCPKLYGDSYA
ncbi:hypothetical protein KJ780_04830 [Candidatus Micrarchaeota archaeon]|nr:hypothetical protein [Candidatus Micrarchaeota archaeon]